MRTRQRRDSYLSYRKNFYNNKCSTLQYISRIKHAIKPQIIIFEGQGCCFATPLIDLYETCFTVQGTWQTCVALEVWLASLLLFLLYVKIINTTFPISPYYSYDFCRMELVVTLIHSVLWGFSQNNTLSNILSIGKYGSNPFSVISTNLKQYNSRKNKHWPQVKTCLYFFPEKVIRVIKEELFNCP